MIVAETTEFLGEAILDLSKYADKAQTSEKLQLTSSADPNSYIEVLVKTKDAESTPAGRQSIVEL